MRKNRKKIKSRELRDFKPYEWQLLFLRFYVDTCRARGVKFHPRHWERIKNGFAMDYGIWQHFGEKREKTTTVLLGQTFWWFYADRVDDMFPSGSRLLDAISK